MLQFQTYLFVRVQYNNLLTLRMESQIDDTIKDQIIKYGTIAIDALIDIVIPFLPPFIDKQDVRSIAVLLLSVITPAAFIGGTSVTVSAISDIAIFGSKTATEITKFGAKAVYYTGKTTLKAVASTAALTTDLLICKPFYLITYPFRNQNKQKDYQRLINVISQSKLNSKQQLNKFTQISKDSDKVFLVIRSIDSQQKIALKMIGNVGPNEPLSTIITYLKQKHTNIDKQSIQFICKNTLVNINTKVGQLPKNEHGFVDLFFTQMQTFG